MYLHCPQHLCEGFSCKRRASIKVLSHGSVEHAHSEQKHPPNSTAIISSPKGLAGCPACSLSEHQHDGHFWMLGPFDGPQLSIQSSACLLHVLVSAPVTPLRQSHSFWVQRALWASATGSCHSLSTLVTLILSPLHSPLTTALRILGGNPQS